MKRLAQTLAIAIGVAGLIVFMRWQLAGGTRPGQETKQTATPWSTDESGFRLAVSLLERCLEAEPVPYRRSFTELRDDGVMLCISPERHWPQPTARDAQAILSWVARRPNHASPTDKPGEVLGNTLLLYTEQNQALLEALKLEITNGTGGPRDWAPARPRFFRENGLALAPRGAGTHIVRLDDSRMRAAERAARVRGQAGAMSKSGGCLPLYTRGEDMQAAMIAYGFGNIVIVIDPWVITNKGLLEGENAAMLVGFAGLFGRIEDRNALGATRVDQDGNVVYRSHTLYVDEYHHGLRQSSVIWEQLDRVGLPLPLILHLGLLFCLVVWRARHRLGRPYEPLAELTREGAEFARARADIHWQMGHTQVVTADLRRRLIAAVRRFAPEAVTPAGELDVKGLPEGTSFPSGTVMRQLASLRVIGRVDLRALGRRVDRLILQIDALREARRR